MIVVDASFVLHFLLKSASAPEVADAINEADHLAAPSLLDYEVVSGLRRLALAKEMSADRARNALTAFLAVPIKRHPLEPFADRIWGLRMNATAYDVSYLALAERLGAPFYTLDRKLGAIPGCTADVIVFHAAL